MRICNVTYYCTACRMYKFHKSWMGKLHLFYTIHIPFTMITCSRNLHNNTNIFITYASFVADV